MWKSYIPTFSCVIHIVTVSSTIRPPFSLYSFHLVCMTLTSCSHGIVSLETLTGSCYNPLTYGLPLSRRTGLWITPSAQSSSSFFSTSGVVWGRENSIFPTHLEPGSPNNKKEVFGSLVTCFLDSDIQLLSQWTLNYTLYLDSPVPYSNRSLNG